MYTLVKRFILNTFFKNGKLVPILSGPLKGYKYNVSPQTGFSSLLGRWEWESQIIYNSVIMPGFVVFDLGANFGIHSLLYSKLIGSDGKVFAFEPLPSNISDLELHKKANNIDNIEIVPVGIADTEGECEFLIADHGSQGSLVGIGKENGSRIIIPITTLDNFCYKNKIFPDFVKIDIEGAEGVALKGFEECVSKTYPFFSIDLHTPEQDMLVGAFMEKFGYEVYRIKNISAIKLYKQKKLLYKISDLKLSYPHKNGVNGVIFCVHPSRKATIEIFLNQNISE